MLKTNGIVIKSIKYGESSLILEILTEQSGILPMIVSGVRSVKKYNASIYHPLQQLSIVHYPTKGESLARIKEAKLQVHYNNLLSHVPITSLGNFMIECVQKVAKELDISSHFYHFTKEGLDFIDNFPSRAGNYHLYFLIELASLIGYELNNNYLEDRLNYFDLTTGGFTSMSIGIEGYSPDESISRNLSKLIGKDWATIESFSFSRNEKYDLIDLLILYFQYHITGFTRPKSLDIFKVVFG